MIHLRRLATGEIEIWECDYLVSVVTKPQAIQFVFEHFGHMPPQALQFIFNQEPVTSVGEVMYGMQSKRL